MTVLLTAVAALLFAVGWMAGKTALVVAWCWSALAVGWDTALRRPDGADASAEVPG
ncbi:MAG: hypothetical protein ACRCZP_15460 [Phycicoccus sp.]